MRNYPADSKYYTYQYVFALSIIALLSFAAYMLVNNAIHKGEQSAQAISINANQIVLSQQITYQAARIPTVKNPEERHATRADLLAAIVRMRDNHKALATTIPPNETIQAIYNQYPYCLDDKIRAFIEQVHNTINVPDYCLVDEQEKFEQVSAQAYDLLNTFQVVDEAYQAESHGRIVRLQRMELFISMATLLTLVLIAFFIFKPMVERIRREKSNLLESKRLMQSVLTTVGEGIITFNPQGEMVMVNKEVEKIWGYQQKELLNQSLCSLIALKEDSKTANLIAYFQQEGWQHMIGGKLELVGKRKDQSIFPLEVKVTETVIGEQELFTVAASDITERKRAEQALLAANTKLEDRVLDRTRELNEANKVLQQEIQDRKSIEAQLEERAKELIRSNADLEQFAFIASHDLKEPLRMIASYVQLLERNYAQQLDDDAKDFIAFALEGAVRANKLVEDLLQYSLIGNTNNEKWQAVDLNQTLVAVQKKLRPAIQQSKAQLQIEKLPVIQAHLEQMELLFTNLVSNAIKFQQENNLPLVEVGVYQEAKKYIFWIKDNGIGMEEKYTDKVFRIFQRLNTRGKYQGTGSGLAICKKIVERHGGGIWFTSTMNEGTTLYFSIPQKEFSVDTKQPKLNGTPTIKRLEGKEEIEKKQNGTIVSKTKRDEVAEAVV